MMCRTQSQQDLPHRDCWLQVALPGAAPAVLLRSGAPTISPPFSWALDGEEIIGGLLGGPGRTLQIR